MGLQRALRAAAAAMILFLGAGTALGGDPLASLASGLADAQSGLRIDGCGIASEDVTRFVLVGQPFTQALHFGPACDVEGTITFDARPSRVDLRVRRAGRVVRLGGFVTSASGVAGRSPFGFSTDLVDGQLSLDDGLRADASVECSFGFSSILSIGRAGEARCRIRVSSVRGVPARFSQSLVFGSPRD